MALMIFLPLESLDSCRKKGTFTLEQRSGFTPAFNLQEMSGRSSPCGPMTPQRAQLLEGRQFLSVGNPLDALTQLTHPRHSIVQEDVNYDIFPTPEHSPGAHSTDSYGSTVCTSAETFTPYSQGGIVMHQPPITVSPAPPYSNAPSSPCGSETYTSHSPCSSPYSTCSSSSPPPCIPTSQFNQLPYMMADLHFPAYTNSMQMMFPYSDMPPHLQVASVWPCTDHGLPSFPEVFDHPSPSHGSLDGEIRIELVDQSLLPNDQPIEYYPPTPPPTYSPPGRYSPPYNPGRGRRRQHPKKPPKPPVHVDATDIQDIPTSAQLWEFVLRVLQKPKYAYMVSWDNKKEGLFRFHDAQAFAALWGKHRNRPNMTYDKVARALRYYYKRDILTQVGGRLTYRFSKRLGKLFLNE